MVITSWSKAKASRLPKAKDVPNAVVSSTMPTRFFPKAEFTIKAASNAPFAIVSWTPGQLVMDQTMTSTVQAVIERPLALKVTDSDKVDLPS